MRGPGGSAIRGLEQIACGRSQAFSAWLANWVLPIARQLGTLALVIVLWAPATVSHAQSTAVGTRLGDFNADSRADLLFRDSNGVLWQYLMNGFQFLAVNVLGAVGTDWKLEAVADFNGDGGADLLFRRVSDGMLSIYLLRGPQILSAQMIGAIGTDWSLNGVGDFNGDGRADLLFRRNSDGMLSLYLMDGFQVAAARLLGAIGMDWRVNAVGDFNGDGRADILTRRTKDGMLALYAFDAFQLIAVSLLGALGTDFDVAGAADFNGDGTPIFSPAAPAMACLSFIWSISCGWWTFGSWGQLAVISSSLGLAT
jgi:FG-GAP-like repeat